MTTPTLSRQTLAYLQSATVPDSLRQEVITLLTSGLARGQKAGIDPDAAMYGPPHIFDVCMREDLGYNIWNNYTDQFLAWLSPQFVADRNKIKALIVDWRNQFSSGGSSDNWCAIPAHVPADLQGCVIEWCFDPNRYYFAARPHVEPDDLQDVCFSLPAMMVNGTRITDQDNWEQFKMFEAQRQITLKAIIQDDAYAPAGANTKPEDGINAWFDNYEQRHPELTGACLQLGPKTVSLTGVALADVPGRLFDIIFDIEYKTKRIGKRIPNENWVLLMNDIDAECLLRAQVCTKICNTNSIALPMDLFTPAGRQVFYNDYNDHMTGGMFGGGYIELPNSGRRISILRDPNQVRGTFELLCKGWEGNPNGLSLAIQDWSKWYRTQRFGASVVAQLMGNGSMLYFITTPAGSICQEAHVRWNWMLFSNAPWLQTKFTNLDADCLTDPNWAAMPNLDHATTCEQVAPVIP